VKKILRLKIFSIIFEKIAISQTISEGKIKINTSEQEGKYVLP
jgi:hypothetical protein